MASDIVRKSRFERDFMRVIGGKKVYRSLAAPLLPPSFLNTTLSPGQENPARVGALPEPGVLQA